MFFLCRLVERKSFFYANFYCSTKLITQFDRNRGLIKYCALCFSWILEVNASEEKKGANPFSSSTPRRKKTTNSFCKE